MKNVVRFTGDEINGGESYTMMVNAPNLNHIQSR